MELPEPKHFNELCRCIGVVILQGQMLESSLARYLVVAQKLEAKVAQKQAFQLLTTLDKSTFGRIKKQIATTAPLPEPLSTLIEFINFERNWMVHRIDKENNKIICNEIEGNKAINRIEILGQKILEALNLLENIGTQMMEKHGFDDNKIKEKAILHTSKRYNNA